uniref:Uncharacterized protein n=1 Tax=Dunaliella tertiolecta TaxID=3047 RepID=A0A7S3QR50_DUNTE
MDTVCVIDYGSRTFRAGYCYSFPSDEEPRVVTPCAVTEEPDPAPPNGLQQQHGDRAGSSAGASTSGQHTHSNCGQQKGRRVGGLIYPVHRGRLEHPEGLEVLLHSAFYELLGWEVDQEGSVVIAEPLFVSRRERELMAQLMFEHFNVNGLYFQDQATLALYALGMLSGMVIDIGHGKVDVSVVADGQVVYASARRLPFAGVDITRYVADLLASRGLTEGLDPLTLEEAAESLKEQAAVAAASGEEYARLSRSNGGGASSSGEKGGSANGEVQARPQASYTLPDGRTLTLDPHEGYQLAEVFLDPSILGFDGPGLAELAMEAATSSFDPVHKRAGHLSDILICGGGSLIPNLPERIVAEMRALAPTNVPEPTLLTMPEYLQGPHTCLHAAWIGGSVLARVLGHQGLLVNKGEYDEFGPASVHRKCA